MTNSTEDSSILYLWKRRSVYIGKHSSLDPLTQGASSLLIAIDEPITIELPDTSQAVSIRSALIPAGLTFRPNTNGHRIANCYLDPFNEDFFRLKQVMQKEIGGIYINSKKEIMQTAAFEKMLRHKMDQKEAYSLLETAVFPSFQEAPKKSIIDPRIIDTIDFIKSNPAVNHTNELLAKRINVSEVTLQRLFKATTGIPIRRFRLWHRLFVTSTLLAFGLSITEAALEAGFSDASHYNHVFKDMFGLPPSSILKRTKDMSIFVDESALNSQLSIL